MFVKTRHAPSLKETLTATSHVTLPTFTPPAAASRSPQPHITSTKLLLYTLRRRLLQYTT